MLGWLKNKHLHDFVHLNSSQIIRLSWFFSSKESKTSKVRKTLRIAASSGEKTPPSEEDSLCFTCDIRFLICQHINCFSAKTWCFYFLSNAYRAFPNFWVGMTSIWQPLSLSLSQFDSSIGNLYSTPSGQFDLTKVAKSKKIVRDQWRFSD